LTATFIFIISSILCC